VSRRVLLAGVIAALSAGIVVPNASAASAMRVVHYGGYRLTVPAGWPVYRLWHSSATCVRFNRHAVYLGKPSVAQNCPTNATGRTEAILVQPRQGARSVPLGGSAMHVVVRTHRVVVTATWRRNAAVIRRALGVHSLVSPPTVRRRPPVRANPPAGRIAELVPRVVSHVLGPPAAPGAIYNGLGFDACSAPSTSAMAAWAASSPFGAVGIYIGGANIACSQPNLNATWVTEESHAGWHLIPIYVGLQAPSNSCGCAAIVAAAAGTEGTAAATDAVAQAQALGIGPGNPIYFDMEGYTRTAVNTSSVLAFLATWTAGLHAAGYKSGIYSNASSGIADLVSHVGTGYVEPDDVWFANWNGLATVSDPSLPTLDWLYGQRLHQYKGGHDDVYGGVKINIDTDYLDGATAAAGAAATVAAAPPVAAVGPTISGTPLVGQTLSEQHAGWSGSPASFSYQWERCNRVGAGCTGIPGATAQSYVATAADWGRTLRVVEGATNVVGPGSPATSSPTAAIDRTASGYWSFTAHGEIYNSLYQHLYGAPNSTGAGSDAIAGMAATTGGLGYWLVTAGGAVDHYGTAAALPAIHPSHQVVGIVTDPAGGYWLYTAQGNVYASRFAHFYGSLARRRTAPVIGMAANRSGRGYWLLAKNGVVRAFGNAKKLPRIMRPGPFAGIVSSPHGGYWLYTTQGNVYRSFDTPWYGSPPASGVHSAPFTGMLATPDGRGYWLTTSVGAVYAYGDAKAYPVPAPAHPVKGLAGPSDSGH
jgi:hypothetical protein